jgi:DNA modification methylase
MWDRSDGRTFTNTPDHFFCKGYDVALHAIKGNAKLAKQGRSNVFRIPPVAASERDFLVERPIELYEELIKHLTIPGEVVADFFAGSGSCPAAAARLARGYFAIDKDQERRAGAIKKIKANTPTAK